MELPSGDVLLKLYRELITARRGEQKMFEMIGPKIFPTGHRGVGEEVVPIAICNTRAWWKISKVFYLALARPGSAVF